MVLGRDILSFYTNSACWLNYIEFNPRDLQKDPNMLRRIGAGESVLPLNLFISFFRIWNPLQQSYFHHQQQRRMEFPNATKVGRTAAPTPPTPPTSKGILISSFTAPGTHASRNSKELEV